MFLQIHTLTSYHASLLNRDDAGLAKRIPFGGATRLRISSQCLKRHWRQWLIEQLKNDRALPSGWRSRRFFNRQVRPRVEEMVPIEYRQIALEALWDFACALFTKTPKKQDLKKLLEKVDVRLARPKQDSSEGTTDVDLQPESEEVIWEPPQAVLFSEPEAQFFAEFISDVTKKAGGDVKEARRLVRKAVLEEWRRKAKDADCTQAEALLRNYHAIHYGLEGALFGRFVTSDVLARVDAPVHVAHAFTTHALDTEMDFFTVVDDLAREEETGGAHMNETELGAGIFYGYVVVDVPLLMSNLTGCDRQDWKAHDPSDAKRLLSLLLHAIAQVTPGAKLGATAPYARAEWALLEVGQDLPRSLANAFLQPVKLTSQTHPMAASVEAAASYLRKLEAMYGKGQEKRFVASCHPWADPAPLPFQEAVENALQAVFGG